MLSIPRNKSLPNFVYIFVCYMPTYHSVFGHLRVIMTKRYPLGPEKSLACGSLYGKLWMGMIGSLTVKHTSFSR